MNAAILVSPGELLDKITILEIKKSRIRQKEKLVAVNRELKLLKTTLAEMLKYNKKLAVKLLPEKKKLKAVNIKLWDIENRIRGKEAKGKFDKEFIALARSVYITNDKRSEIKNSINKLFGSSIHEVKQYKSYQ